MHKELRIYLKFSSRWALVKTAEPNSMAIETRILTLMAWKWLVPGIVENGVICLSMINLHASILEMVLLHVLEDFFLQFY